MNLFLQRKVDSASAMTYNELAQVLESKNPDTGKLYTLADLNVIKMEDVGTGMLEDGIFVRGDWLKIGREPGDIADGSSKATFKGWVWCRDHLADCMQIVLKNWPDPRQGPSDVADERDQRADLAGAAGHRRHEPGRRSPGRRDRAGSSA